MSPAVDFSTIPEADLLAAAGLPAGAAQAGAPAVESLSDEELRQAAGIDNPAAGMTDEELRRIANPGPTALERAGKALATAAEALKELTQAGADVLTPGATADVAAAQAKGAPGQMDKVAPVADVLIPGALRAVLPVAAVAADVAAAPFTGGSTLATAGAAGAFGYSVGDALAQAYEVKRGLRAATSRTENIKGALATGVVMGAPQAAPTLLPVANIVRQAIMGGSTFAGAESIAQLATGENDPAKVRDSAVWGTVLGSLGGWLQNAQTKPQRDNLIKFSQQFGFKGKTMADLRAWWREEGRVLAAKPVRAAGPAEAGAPAEAPPTLSPAAPAVLSSEPGLVKPAPPAIPPVVTAPIAPIPVRPSGPTVGADWAVKTPDTDKVPVAGVWRVVEGANLITSLDPGYTVELQPRDRTRAASHQQIERMARALEPQMLADSYTSDLGSPFVAATGEVLSGNGRTEAIRRAYADFPESAAAYRAHVEATAAQLGMDPAAVAAMQDPVLVREVTDFGGLTPADFADRSNRAQVMGMSESETATADASIIQRNPQLLRLFRPSAEGDVLAATNREFLNTFAEVGGVNTAELMNSDGSGWNSKMSRRVSNAMLAALVGPEKRTLVDSLVEDSEGIRKVAKPLLVMAPRLIGLQGSPYDLSAAIAKAASDYVSLKRSGENIDDYLAQTDMFGDATRTAESDALLQAFDQLKSAAKVTEFLARYVELAGKVDAATGDMFGQTNAPALELLQKAYHELTNPQGPAQDDLTFGQPPPSAGQPPGGVTPPGVRGGVPPAGAGAQGGTVRESAVTPNEGAAPQSKGSPQGGPKGAAGYPEPPVRTAGSAAPKAAGAGPTPPTDNPAWPGGEFGKPGQGVPVPNEPRMNLDAVRLELPEILQFARAMGEGRYPKVRARLGALRHRALGVFKYVEGEGAIGIELRRDIFRLVTPQELEALRVAAKAYAAGVAPDDPVARARIAKDKFEQEAADLRERRLQENPLLASKVLAHELGHWIDHVGLGQTLTRGNVFGHIAAVVDYLKHTLPIDPASNAQPLTAQEREALHRRAESELRKELGPLKEIIKTIIVEVPEYRIVGVTPDDVKALFGMEAREAMPELYDWFASQSREVKAAIVRAAMKNIVDERIAALGKKEVIGTRKVEKTIRERQGREPTAKEIQERFRQLLREEIARRRLAELAALKAELRPVIAWWRGAGAEMEVYFEKPEEMYAEGLSIWLNNPAELARRAPVFFEMIMRYLERRPEVKQRYDRFTDLVRTGAVQDNRRANLLEAFAKNEQITLEMEQAGSAARRAQTRDALVMGFDRTFGPAYRLNKALAKDDPRLAVQIDDAIRLFRYRATAHEYYLRRLNLEVLAPLAREGLSFPHYGEYNFHLWIKQGRTDIANPLGFSPATSTAALEHIKAHTAPEAWAALEAAHAADWKMRNEVVLQPLREPTALGVTILGPTLQKFIEGNDYYATIAVTPEWTPAAADTIAGWAQLAFGPTVGAKIFTAHGTLAEIKNPFLARVEKDLSLLSFLYRERAKHALVKLIEETSGMISPARTRWNQNTHRQEPVEITTSIVGTLYTLQAGKVVAYYVPRVLAEMFESRNAIDLLIMEPLNKALQPFAGVLTQFNYGFWPVAFARDIRMFVLQVPGASYLVGKGAILPRLPAALRAARASVTSRPNHLADEVLRRMMVGSRADPRGTSVEDEELARLLLRHGQEPAWWNGQVEQVHRAWQAFLWYAGWGQTFERGVKIAGMMHLDTVRAAMAEETKRKIVTSRAGSPDFWEGARYKAPVSWLMLFYMAAKEGYRARYESIKDDPVAAFLKFVKYTGGPALLYWLFENGAFDAGLDKATAEDLRAQLASIPENDKLRGMAIPLGWVDRDQRKVVYLIMPWGDTERIDAAIARKAAQSITGNEHYKQGLDTLFAYQSGDLPGLNPALTMADAVMDYWRGTMPTDRYGRPVLSEAEMGGRVGGLPLALWAGGELTGGLFGRRQVNPLENPRTTKLEEFLALPVVSNLVGRWIRVSNRGYAEQLNSAGLAVTQHRQQLQVIGREMARKTLAGEPFTASEKKLMGVEPYLGSYWFDLTQETNFKRSDPLIRALEKAPSADAEEAIMRKAAQMPKPREVSPVTAPPR